MHINAIFQALVEAQAKPPCCAKISDPHALDAHMIRFHLGKSRHQTFEPDADWRTDKMGKTAPGARQALDRSELGAPWKRAHVPIAQFMDRPAHAPSCCTRPSDHSFRINGIDHWVRRRHKGDVQQALRQNPVVLAQKPDGQLDLVDGYHRTLHAQAKGHTHVPAVIVRSTVNRSW